MPLAGRLSDVYGRVRMFQAALVLFSIGSGLVAVAPDFSWIVSLQSDSKPLEAVPLSP